MTASYDGSVRLFAKTRPEEAVYTFSSVNKASVNGGKATGLSCAVWTQNAASIAMGGLDGRVQLWSVDQGEEEGEWRGQRKWMGEAHNAPVSAIDTAEGPAGTSVISGGWDGVVAVWDDIASSSSAAAAQSEDEDEEEDEEESSAKRRKTVNGKSTKAIKGSSSKPGHLDPTLTLWHASPSAHTPSREPKTSSLLRPESPLFSLNAPSLLTTPKTPTEPGLPVTTASSAAGTSLPAASPTLPSPSPPPPPKAAPSPPSPT